MAPQGRKTSPPLLPSPILFREVLYQKLTDALISTSTQASTACKLVLLRAPAGYGKTTLLADFARRNQIPVGWYFLDHTDTQLPIFLETLTRIFCQTFPELAHTLSHPFLQEFATILQSGNYLQSAQVLEHYTDALEQHITRPFILCLCDYQEINEEEAIQVVLNQLLRKMPTMLSLVVESRVVPSLELSPLLARRQLLGLGEQALGFSPQEVQAYAHLQRGLVLTDEEAERLANTFDGWIAGLLLVTPLGDPFASFTDKDWITPVPFERQTLLAYVKNEVFAQEDQAFTFLQETAVLAHLSAVCCNYLLSVEHADALLTHIEGRGLFLSRVPAQGNTPTYALHPTLRQLFSEDMQHNQPERTAWLHYRAAEFFRTKGDDERAITHAIAAQEYPLAMDIMVQAARPESTDPLQQATLMRWFAMLPMAIREQHSPLLLMRARLYITQREYLQAAPLLEQAYQLVTRPSSPFTEDSSPTLLAEILIARSTIPFQEGLYTQAQQMCQEALEYLTADMTELRIPALIRLGICKTLMCDYAEGLSYFHQALHLSGHANMTQQTASIHGYLANSYSLVSNYALAEHHRARAIAISEQLNNTQGQMNNCIWMAILKSKKGAFQEAETLLQDTLTRARQAGFQSSEAYTLYNLGGLFLDTSVLPQALMYLEACVQLARQIGDNRLVDQALCDLAMVYLLLADSHTADILLAQTTVATTGQVGYEGLGYELVRCTVLLYQQEFVAASAGFRAFEPLASQAQLKRSQIECLIRLAVCQYRLDRLAEMEEAMQKVVHIVEQGHAEHIPLIELRRFPDVWQVVQRLSNKACLDTWRDTSPKQAENEETQERQSIPVESQSRLEFVPQAKLHIRAFGEPSVLIDGQPVTRWYMARSLEMCFFLLDYQRPIRKEQLVEALWPAEEEYVDQTVRSALHYLRKVIGSSCITSHGGMYTLNLSALYGDDIWYDVTHFQQHHMQAQDALDAEHDEQAEEHLRAMIDLYRGDYVQSFYSNWCTSRRDVLRRQYMDACRDLARITWGKEHYEESLVHWQQMLTVDPCSEEAHGGLMRCYTRLGKRSLAIRQYQRCTEVLQRELAIAPGITLQKLYQRIANNV